MIIQDWAHTAYEAASRGDRDGIAGTVVEITRRGHRIVDAVTRLWMDRTIYVMRGVRGSTTTALTVELDWSALGEMHLWEDEIRWAGQMFTAHANGDTRARAQLWAQISGDIHAVDDRVAALLVLLTQTAAVYAQAATTRTCCGLHRDITGDVLGAARKIAVAHLN